MDLQNRDGNFAKTETPAPFLSDLKLECRCRTVQRKSSSSLSFCYWNGFSIKDLSRDSIGFLLPRWALCFSVSVSKDYCPCNANQVTITSAGMWKVPVAALPSPKATLFLLPCIPLSLCRHSLCLPATFLPCRPLLQQFSPTVQPSGAISVPVVITFEG